MKKTTHNSIIKHPKSFKLTSLTLAITSAIFSFNAMAFMPEYVAGVKDKTVTIEDGKTISGTSIKVDSVGSIFGGKHETASTTNNKIEATKITSISTKLFGGYTEEEGKVSQKNKVTVVGKGQASDAIKASIMAGVSVNGTASENEVLIQKIGELKSINPTKATDIIGGKGKSATMNTVTVEGLENTGTSLAVRIWGGYAEEGEASDNHVILKNISEIKDKSADKFALIYGGKSNSNGNLNTVTIEGISAGATIHSNIIGSISKGGRLEENEVKLTNIKEIESAYVIGAQATGVPPMGSEQVGSSVSGNKVEITGIADGAILSTEITGGLAQQGHVKNNQVNLANIKEINQDIYGGRDKEQGTTVINSIRSVATPPTAVVTAPVINGESKDAVASDNNVSIFGIGDGATLSADIYGGFVENESLRNYRGKTYIENNAITLVNVRSNKGKETNIYAGLAYSNKTKNLESIEVNNNSITIAGNSDLSNTNLYGGIAYEPQVPGKTERTVLKDDFTGNTLHIGIEDTPWYNTKGKNAVKSLRGIQKIQFNTVNWDEGKAALTILEKSDLSKTTIDATRVHFANLSELLDGGKKMTLIDTHGNDDGIKAENLNKGFTSDDGYAPYTVGPSLEGRGKPILAENGKDVLYVIKQEDSSGETVDQNKPDQGGETVDQNKPDQGGEIVDQNKPDQGGEIVDPNKPDQGDEIIVPVLKLQAQTHNVMIGNVASLTAVNGGQNFVERALSSNLGSGQYGSSMYFATSGGYDKYKTGSHIKTNVWNANLSMVNTVELASGGLAYLAGFEYGTGSYDVKGDGINGDGDVDYQGLNLGMKYLHNSGFYSEVSTRIGYVKNKANNVLADKYNAYSYETSGYYAGGHLGLGYILSLNENLNLDIYSKYSYMNIEKDKFNLADTEYRLDAIESSIVKAGFKINQAYNNWNFTYGLGVEHQFDGEAKGTIRATVKGTVHDYAIKSADIGGTSGIVEFSATLKPSMESPWSFNFGVDGYVGRHQGARGNVGLSYKF